MQDLADSEAPIGGASEGLSRIGAADIVVGIPTYNNLATVTRAVAAAMTAPAEGLPLGRLVIVQADGGSRDGTVERVRETVGEQIPLLQTEYPLYPADRLAAPLAGVVGRREAAYRIFRFARQLGAKVCVMLDAEVESVEPNWVGRLAGPVLEGNVDLLVPWYRRHKFDGLINSGIISPLARTLFGKRLRQSSGADLALSSQLMDFHLAQSAASDGKPPSILDPWSAIAAVTHGYRVGQCFLGPRVARPRDDAPDLSGVLRLALGDVFSLMEQTAAMWQKVRGSEAVAWFGPPPEFEPDTAEFSRKPMINAFLRGCQDLLEIWKLVLSPAILVELRRMEKRSDDDFRMTDELWARTVYDFALAYHMRVMSRDHVLQAIAPLYLGWAASFTGEVQAASGPQVEERLDRLAAQFEAEKRYLISRWRWPDRFNP